MKIIIFLTLLLTLINAKCDWKEQYQKGLYKKEPRTLYALSEMATTQKDYQKLTSDLAIKDLSKQMYTQVSSTSKIDMKSTDQDAQILYSEQIHISSNIPVIGHHQENVCLNKGRYSILLSIPFETASALYEQKAVDLQQEITILHNSYQKARSFASKEMLLKQLQSALINYQKYYLVAGLMNANHKIKKPTISLSNVEYNYAMLLKQPSNSVSDLAAKLLSSLPKEFLHASVSIKPFEFETSESYSRFSADLQESLKHEWTQKKLQETKEELSITGKYIINNDILKTILYVNDANGTILTTAMGTIPTSRLIYSDFIPKQNSYDTLSNTVINEHLSVMAQINGESKNLLFKKGEKLRLDIKVSQESYVYIIANMRDSQGNQIQYLLPINDADGMKQYQYYIPFQMSNIWVNVGEFEVYAPFGAETLQVFASNDAILTKLPNIGSFRIDGEVYDGVLLSNSNIPLEATQSISKVRGIKRTSNIERKTQLSETLIRFTTME